MKRFLYSLIAVVGLTTAATGQVLPEINGMLDDFYGEALSVQNTNTQFGNGTAGDPANGGGGSEIDQVFGRVSGNRLYMFIAGNLETNFNKLTLLFDSVDGGVNTIVGSELPAGVDSFCCGGFEPPNGNNPSNFGALQRMDGTVLDEGFDADYFLTLTHGFEKLRPDQFDELQFYGMSAHYAELNQGTEGRVVAAGMTLAPNGLPNVLRAPGDGLGDAPAVPDDPAGGFGTMVGPALPGLSQGELIDRAYALGAGGCDDDTGAGCIAAELEFALDVDPAETNQADPMDNNTSSHRNFDNAIDLRMAVNNSNTEGVSGLGPYEQETEGNPADVMTGVEFSIPLEHLGNPKDDIRVTVYINGSGHDFSSNQFGGTGILAGNLASDVDLTIFAGEQFVTIEHTGFRGDFDKDGDVDGDDFLIWQSSFRTASGATQADGDADGDGDVDGDDFLIWQADFPTISGGSGASSVPEPGTLAVAVLLGCLIGVRRRD